MYTFFCFCIIALLIELNPTLSVQDWLIHEYKESSKVVETSYGTLLISNGLVFREFSMQPAFTTISLYSKEQDSAVLRALNPETVVQLDSITYNVGSLNSSSQRAYFNATDILENSRADSGAFSFYAYEVTDPVAPFPYTPARGAPKDIVWPPKGLVLNTYFKAPSSAPFVHQCVRIGVHYQIYDGIPAISKWVSARLDTTCKTRDVNFKLIYAEKLSVNNNWAPKGLGRDPQCSIEQSLRYTNCFFSPLYVETDQAHGTLVNWKTSPDEVNDWGSFMPVVTTVQQPLVDLGLVKPFTSFKTNVLAIGSDDMERISLAMHRLFRLLAPHAQENPIFFHQTELDKKSFRESVDKLAEVGFEMIIHSFGSGFNIESENETYIQEIASNIAYANKKGIEVGGYDLIALSRNNIEQKFLALPEKSSACFASEWYDHLLERFLTFINKTGLSSVETDGPYGGYSCSSTEHAHHVNEADSIYRQQEKQNKFYQILRTMKIYINQPDYYFYIGGSRTGLGYNENQYSLPRWQDISISRQSIHDDTYRLIPTAGWMFVPLVVYHQGGDAAMFEPLTQHKVEYEWALAQYLGAGVAACYRGFRVYDGPETKAIVSKWVGIYKKYRDIITSDIVHIRRADMQSVDSFMHVNPRLKNKGFVMVFNPVNEHVNTSLSVPLYYTGLTNRAKVSQEGSPFVKHHMRRDYTINLQLYMKPLGITWFLIH